MVDVIRELWITELEAAKAIIPNAAHVGASLAQHGDHIVKTIEQQGCQSVLCIGRGAVKSALFAAPRKAFDMVIVCKWAGTIALADQAKLVGLLRSLTVKVLYVIEGIRDHQPAEPGTMQRPDGWDRMDWSFNLSLFNGPKVRLVTHGVLPDGTDAISRLKTDDGRLWVRDV